MYVAKTRDSSLEFKKRGHVEVKTKKMLSRRITPGASFYARGGGGGGQFEN